MKKLSVFEMKMLSGGEEDNGIGTKGGSEDPEGGNGIGTRSTCIAIVQYRHSNSPVFTRVPNCNAATKDGSMVVSCSC